MKKVLLFSVILISINAIAQNGINYKALIKDTNGNVLTSSPINIQFIIYEGSALTNNVYQENHTINTDTNGFVMVNIGEGATSNDFSAIQWSNDEHFLNVQVNTGNGLIDLGTTAFKSVPYAKVAENVSGLEQITEDENTGWRLIGRDPNHYGDIGNEALDLSYSNVNSTTNGATGNFAISLGSFNEASGLYATTIGTGTRASEYSSTTMGFQTLASEDYAMAMGLQTIASGYSSTAMGNNTEASGQSSVAMGSGTTASGGFSTAIGRDTRAESFNTTVIGRYNLGGGDPSDWNSLDPLFEIGNGTSGSDRNNALTVLKSGYHIINSTSTGLYLSSVATGIIINSQSNGVSISTPGVNGISVSTPGVNGISVSSAGSYGARLSGDSAGVFTENTNDNNPDIIIGGDDAIISTDSTPSADLFVRSNDAVVIELDVDNNETGNFRVRNGTGNNVFDVNEAGNATLAGSLTQNSDRRLKTNIKNLPYGLAEILQLQPKSYNWKENKQGKKSLGLIAQDVQDIIKEVVNIQDDEQKTLGISYVELIPVLIKAMQEQQDIISIYKEEVSELSQEIQIIKKELKSIKTSSSQQY